MEVVLSRPQAAVGPSRLWDDAGEKDLQCFNIDYFPREEYSPDPNDSTMAIP
ncbi:uncharacterized protein GBIM_01395, partial [Gryllus bimaculatus]